MTWLSVIIAGILTYITRMTMITLVDRNVLGSKLKQVLGYVPAAVFPAIIFPAIFFNDYGNLIEITDPEAFYRTHNSHLKYLKIHCIHQN